MRIAFISDIHGYQYALESVLSDLEKRKVNRIICLGDTATLGPQPKESLEILQGLKADFILGNHDDAILSPQKFKDLHIPQELIPSLEWTISKINNNQIEFIKTFKDEIEIYINNSINILCYHGSPKSIVDIILYTTTENNLDKMFQDKMANIYVGGHTHTQMKRNFKDSLVINPGSVGSAFKQLPMSGKDPILQPWAEYAILEVDKKVIIFEMYQVQFDLQKTIQGFLKSNSPMKEWYLKQFI